MLERTPKSFRYMAFLSAPYWPQMTPSYVIWASYQRETEGEFQPVIISTRKTIRLALPVPLRATLMVFAMVEVCAMSEETNGQVHNCTMYATAMRATAVTDVRRSPTIAFPIRAVMVDGVKTA